MTAAELDEIYSALSHRLTAVGEEHALLYLCRLALLLANEISDTAVIHRALDAAQPSPARGCAPAPASAPGNGPPLVEQASSCLDRGGRGGQAGH